MNELLVGFFFCAVPAVTVLGIVALVARAMRPSDGGTRVEELELDVRRLRGENATLMQRVSRLEAAMTEVYARGVGPAPSDVARAPGATEVVEAAPVEAAPVEAAPVEPAPVEAAPVEAGPLEAAPTEPEPARDAAIEPIAASIASEAPADAAAPEEAAPIAPAPALPEAARVGDTGAPAVPRAPDASWTGPPASAAPTPPPAPPPPAPEPPAAPSIQWEQWIGVRGAAALGASILVLAGIYFFEYSIEHGLITPAMRMIAGTLVGLGCVLASELRLRKSHEILANWIAGAGIAILYVAFWAGRALYELYPTWAAGILLVATTGAGVALAVRHGSIAIAALGLFGGFITPLALSTGSDRPIALFSYLLLLDAAMLWVAYRQRWAWMGIGCLVATSIYQAGWLFGRLDEPRMVIGVLVVAVFAILFAALPTARPKDGPAEDGAEDESVLWRLVRSAGVLVPLLLTSGLALRTSLGDTFWPTSILLALLTVAATIVGLRHRSPLLPSGAALGAIGALLGWAVAHPPDTALGVWELVGLALALALILVAGAEVGRRLGRDSALPPAALYGGAVLIIAMVAAPALPLAGPWPWMLTWAALLGAGLVLGRQAPWTKIPIGYAAIAALGLGATFVANAGNDGQPPGSLFLGLLVLAAALLSVVGVAARGALRRDGDHASATFAAVLLLAIAGVHDVGVVPSWAFYGAALILTVLVLLVAARRATSAWMFAAMVLAVLAQGIWVARADAVGPIDLAGLTLTVLLLAFFPALSPASLRDQTWAWRTAALAGPASLLALRHVYLEVLGASTIGLLPVALAAISIGAAYLSRARGPHSEEARRVALVWLVATGAGFVTLAIPMQLSNEWITIGWALEALALTAIWYRLDHSGVKYLAFALATAVTIRLLANPYVLDYAGRGWPILNWIAYTYLIPAACVVGMWALLRRRELARRRPWETQILGEKHAVLANVAAAFAIALVFAWINLAIIDVFTEGSTLQIPRERLPARDLSLSIAWAVYALALLALGMLRQSTALRVTSLALILVTCGKAFLYDLAHLSDLYRVASLVGLAISLILISLAYQRFVFRAPKEAVQ